MLEVVVIDMKSSDTAGLDVVVVQDLNTIMDFHEQVWGIPIGPTIERTKEVYKEPRKLRLVK